MGSRGEIRIDPAPPPPHNRRWGAGAAALLLAFLGVLALLGGSRESGSAAPETTVPDPDRQLLENARSVTAEFAAAWNRGEVAAVSALISDDWDTVMLPGFTDSWFDREEGRRNLEDGIGFLTTVSELDLGPCYTETAPPDSPASVVVSCFEAAFRGDYVDAVQRNTWEAIHPQPENAGTRTVAGIRFGIRSGRIIDVTARRSPFTPQAYCIWAEQAGVVGAEFDLHCQPVTTPETGDAHARAAAAFVDAGAPLPSPQVAEARIAAGYPDLFAELHNLGDTLTIRNWLSSQVRAADLPGYPATDDDPSLTRYLLWSSRLLEIEIGTCTIDIGGGETVVTCPELAVSGPLLGAPVAQPTRFTIASLRRGSPVARSYSRILAVEPLDAALVPIEPICRRLQESGSEAASAFDDDCTPIFTLEAANMLRAALRA